MTKDKEAMVSTVTKMDRMKALLARASVGGAVMAAAVLPLMAGGPGKWPRGASE